MRNVGSIISAALALGQDVTGDAPVQEQQSVLQPLSGKAGYRQYRVARSRARIDLYPDQGALPAQARVLENYNESISEENFICPVLCILGHYFGVQ